MTIAPLAEHEPAASGFCPACGRDHQLGQGTARHAAHELMRSLERYGRLDFDRPRERANPRLTGARLWNEGRMFGVLECRDPQGTRVVLRAFSSLGGGVRWVDGWSPPLVSRVVAARRIRRPELAIKRLTRQLARLDPNAPEYHTVHRERRNLSRALMAEMHGLYRLRNPRGQTASVRDAFTGAHGIPGGVGECCAPKLLTHAADLGLTPVGLAEFYWGPPVAALGRVSGTFYAACERRCRPILGFLLCGLLP